MRRLIAVATLLVGCDGAFGAGDKPSGGDAGSWLARSPRALACRELAAATCGRIESCAPFLARTSIGTGPTCVDALTMHCVRTAGIGGSRRTAGDLAACAKSVAASACGPFLERFPEVCEVPPGTLSDGEGCAFDEQCQSSFCAREADTACGRCARAPLAGAPCAFGSCAHGLLCNVASTCVRPGAPFDACGPNQPCGRLLFCDGARCVERKKELEPCAGFGQCDPFAATTCSEDSLCRPSKIARLGEPCDLAANALTLCEAPSRCIDGRCAPPKAEGAACGAAGAHECEGFGSECLRGRCVKRTIEACQK